jgi:peptide-methionine (S)-S-oxide reductase
MKSFVSRHKLFGVAACGLALNLLAFVSTMNADSGSKAETSRTSSGTRLATVGGGCFWCVEAVFERFEGVKDVVSGYAAGRTPNPTYKEIGTGQTGHAEAVQIEFDPAKITYEQLLDIFWEAHDPTTLNRQGADRGTQYRSIILHHDEAQKKAAEKSKQAAAKKFKDPVVTEKGFRRARGSNHMNQLLQALQSHQSELEPVKEAA